MFNDFFGLSKNPFDKHHVTPADAFVSEDHRQATSRLHYLVSVRGIGVFTSPPGFGKTFALRCFAASLDRNLHELAYLCLSTVTLTEFYRQLCSALGFDPPHGKPALFKAIQDRLFLLFKEKRRPFVLICDEAHELSPAILKDIKMIMNHDFDSCCCFSLVLAGEPHLNSILSKPVHEALRQRITVHYDFAGLSDAETRQYLLHKLRSANAADSILSEGSLAAIASAAAGCPRRLDSLMNQALIIAAQLGLHSIDTDTVMAAADALALS